MAWRTARRPWVAACAGWSRETRAATPHGWWWERSCSSPWCCGRRSSRRREWGIDLPNMHLLTAITFLPALGAIALLLLRGDDHMWIRRLALTTSLAEFALSLLLIPGVPIGKGGYGLEEFHTWISNPAIHYHLGVDGISLFLVLLTTFLTPIAILVSWASINMRVKEFFLMLLVLETGVIGVFLSLDLFLFFLFWEVMLLPMYFLIGVWGHERRIYAAVKFVLFTMAGSILMLVGILSLHFLAVDAGAVARSFD